MLGDSVEITEGYRTWWSYIPHFIGTPGYVYAYAYGQLLALSVYRAYEEQGADFVPPYLELLAAGGSRSPEELGRIVGVDLADPGFWDGGLAIVEEQLEAAEAAAKATGRLVTGRGSQRPRAVERSRTCSWVSVSKGAAPRPRRPARLRSPVGRARGSAGAARSPVPDRPPARRGSR